MKLKRGAILVVKNQIFVYQNMFSRNNTMQSFNIVKDEAMIYIKKRENFIYMIHPEIGNVITKFGTFNTTFDKEMSYYFEVIQ